MVAGASSGSFAGERRQLVEMRGEDGAAAMRSVAAPPAPPRRWRARPRWRCRGPPRPHHRERAVAWFRMAAVSAISTMKVDSPARDVVRRADAGEQPVHQPQPGAHGRHDSPAGRGSPAARSAAGRSICPPCSAPSAGTAADRPTGRHRWARRRAAPRASARLHHPGAARRRRRNPAGRSVPGGPSGHRRPARRRRHGGRAPPAPPRRPRCPWRPPAGPAQMLRHHPFPLARLLAGLGHPAVEIGERGAGEAHGVRHGLAVHRGHGAVLRTFPQQLLAGRRGQFREEAELLVVADLQARHAPGLRQIPLQRGDRLPRAVAQPAQGVELAVIAWRDQPATSSRAGSGSARARASFAARARLGQQGVAGGGDQRRHRRHARRIVQRGRHRLGPRHPSRMAPRSRGAKRSSDSRARARAMSGAPFSAAPTARAAPRRRAGRPPHRAARRWRGRPRAARRAAPPAPARRPA